MEIDACAAVSVRARTFDPRNALGINQKLAARVDTEVVSRLPRIRNASLHYRLTGSSLSEQAQTSSGLQLILILCLRRSRALARSVSHGIMGHRKRWCLWQGMAAEDGLAAVSVLYGIVVALVAER